MGKIKKRGKINTEGEEGYEKEGRKRGMKVKKRWRWREQQEEEKRRRDERLRKRSWRDQQMHSSRS